MKQASKLLAPSTLLAIALSLLIPSLAVAERDEAPAVNATVTKLPTATVTPKSEYDIAAPVVGDYTIHAGVKSQNTAGRSEELASDTGRRYKLKNEYYVGATHKNGWGAQLMAVTNGTTKAQNSANAYGAGDPSFTLIHPAFYRDANFSVWGQVRQYAPVSSRSKMLNQYQSAYYLFSSFNMPGNVNLFNQATPRYFSQSTYAPGDTNWYIEDYTTLTKKVNSWFKYGVGQHAQVEWHDKTSAGRVIEVYPLANFTLTSNIFIEPRFYLPVYSVNSVYDSPKSAALSQTQAEVYMQISM